MRILYSWIFLLRVSKKQKEKKLSIVFMSDLNRPPIQDDDDDIMHLIVLPLDYEWT